MKAPIIILVVVSLVSCGQESVTPKEKMHIRIERLSEGDDLIIALLNIEFEGEKVVRLSEGTSLSQAKISPDSKTGISTCQVLIIADRIKFRDECQIKWLYQISGSGTSVGGPDIHTADPDMSLRDILGIEIESGEYPVDAKIKLATFRGQPLYLNVAKEFARS